MRLCQYRMKMTLIRPWICLIALVVCVVLFQVSYYMKTYFVHVPPVSHRRVSNYNPGLIRDEKIVTMSTMIDRIISSEAILEDQSPTIPRNYSCSGLPTFHGVEDLLCQQPPPFNKTYKNPCWYNNGQFMCLPYFHVIGVSKCGTTDLFARILNHPSILHNDGYVQKEIFWWCCKRYGHYLERSHAIEGFSRYWKYFSSASKSIKKLPSNDFITGDGTPRDSWCMTGWETIPQNRGLEEPTVVTPHLMKHINPNVKLVVILRDPVERLYSDFCFLRKGNKSASGFDRAVRQSIAVLYKCTLQFSLRRCLYNRSIQLGVATRIYIGFYFTFMKDWLDVFPRDQLLILRTEDYHRDMSSYIKTVFEFLQVRNLTATQLDQIVTKKVKNSTKGKSKAGPMQNDTRAILRRLYQPFNAKLAALLRDSSYLWHN